MPAATFYWHDYETFGTDPARDRPVQFAGLRTDESLNVVGEPLVVYCQPPLDSLPAPEACLITGITPQVAREQGVIEAEFIGRILAELAVPGTCGAGYNSLRFDDEFTRYTLFRNFHDPYAREWQNDCSRWDIIDLARMTAALRPEGIEWPLNDKGKPSFRLEKLTAANGLEHADAHDALSDVRATIAFARLIREKQPRLFQWLLDLRSKHKVAELIDTVSGKPLVHTSRMYPSTRWCTSLVMPLVHERRNRNSVLVYDLRVDPGEFLDLSVEELHQRLYTPLAELGNARSRLPVKAVRSNRCPALAPEAVLDDAAAERIELDRAQCERHRQVLLSSREFAARVEQAVSMREFPPSGDVDASLYDGFLGDHDRALCRRVTGSTPAELASGGFAFEDARLEELLLRYRARNWPDSLDDADRERWLGHLEDIYHDESRGLESWFEAISACRERHPDSPEKLGILDQLESWGDELLAAVP